MSPLSSSWLRPRTAELPVCLSALRQQLHQVVVSSSSRRLLWLGQASRRCVLL
jgi:hypothetical protein